RRVAPKTAASVRSIPLLSQLASVLRAHKCTSTFTPAVTTCSRPAAGLRSCTIAHLLPLLPGCGRDVMYIATSPQTEQGALELGLNVQPFTTLDRLDLAIDRSRQGG